MNNLINDFLNHCRRRLFSPRRDIIFHGDKGESLYYLIEGTAIVFIESDDGKEIIVSYLQAGDFFGEMGLFDDDLLRSAGVRAKSVCRVAEISYLKFYEIIYSYPGIMFAIAKQTAQRLRVTSQKAMDLAFVDVTGRIARALLQLCHQPEAKTHPDGIQISVTRYEMSKIVGCSREMVGRVYSALEEQGVVSIKGKNLLVHRGYVSDKARSSALNELMCN